MVVKPTSKEEEYFVKLDLEQKRKLAHEQRERMQAEERKLLKERHWMRCPKCGMELAEVAYRGLKIDQCTSCNGVWLDAGELDAVAAAEKGGVLGSFQKLFKG